MDIKDVTTIRETIQQAKLHESKTGHLSRLLQDQIPQLHSSIRLPEDNAEAALIDFITRYIEHVPDFVEAISHVTSEAQVFDYAETFLRIAKDYFLHPPEFMQGHLGMDALMDEAYLAHRLMEEVNDRFIAHCGTPLAPMDMTRSNLIVHHLIGEPFANQLDLAVQYSVELCMSKEKVFEQADFQRYLNTHRQSGWRKELEQWPCLAKDLEIRLDFSDPKTAETTPQLPELETADASLHQPAEIKPGKAKRKKVVPHHSGSLH